MKIIQLGKNGLTDSFVEQVKSLFKHDEIVKVIMLKSSTRDKAEAKKIADSLMEKLGDKYSYRMIGYVLVVRKWRKPQKKAL